MRIFSPLYDRVLRWAGHPHAPWYLGGLSFAESSFFPVPPDVMLAPMTLARPRLAWRFAFITTAMSVLGGLFGYFIGVFALELVEGLLQQWGYWEGYLRVRSWFDEWGFWAVFIAGFSPVPYKLFTVSAGALAMNLPMFLLASVISRGARFYLVAGLIRFGGERMERQLREYIDMIGWIVIVLCGILLLIWKL
ncbi:MAG TPA: YqaA family protein [Gammaproteobacteria bacterium]|nr:YqaA family protein [Gammaproteobacteria bacterium]